MKIDMVVFCVVGWSLVEFGEVQFGAVGYSLVEKNTMMVVGEVRLLAIVQNIGTVWSGGVECGEERFGKVG